MDAAIAAQADLLLHVIDSSNIAQEEQISEVNKVLEEIGAKDIPRILVYNKLDASGKPPFLTSDDSGRPIAVGVSAQTGEGLDLLKDAIREIAVAEHEKVQTEEEPDNEDWLAEFER